MTEVSLGFCSNMAVHAAHRIQYLLTFMVVFMAVKEGALILLNYSASNSGLMCCRLQVGCRRSNSIVDIYCFCTGFCTW